MLAKSLEKLSSGYRINRAADDASGLVISQGLRAQVSGLRQATRNAQDGVSVVQTAEGALTEVHAMLNRIRDLIVQSANTASSDTTARQAAQNEITQLRSEIDRIARHDGVRHPEAARTAPSVRRRHVQPTSATGRRRRPARPSAALACRSPSSSTRGHDQRLAARSTLTTGTYATAASFEAQLQTQISGAISAAIATGFTGGVTVNVRDLGSGAWSVELVRNNTAISNSKITTTAIGTGLGAARRGFRHALSNTGGGVFQVGANVTTTNQIAVSIDDIRITERHQRGVHVALGHRRDRHVHHRLGPGTDRRRDLRRSATLGASSVRRRTGSSRPSANLQVTTENLSASESRIRDTDMALEMVSFTRHQILLQAGTAMFAQANAAPQSMLRLLQ